MSVTRDPDRIIAAWLEAGPTRLPDVSRQTIVDIARSTPQSGRGGVTSRSGVNRFQALGLAATVGLVGLLGALAISGGPQPTPSVAPDRASVAPDRASPAPSIAPTSAFSSPLYGYSIAPRMLGIWDFVPATVPWVAGEERVGEVVDRFDPGDASGARPLFTVAVADVPGGVSDDVWIADAIPSRLSGTADRRSCLQSGADQSGPAPEPPWSQLTVGDRVGRMRMSCGFVDGVLIVDRRAFVFTAEGAPQLDGASTFAVQVFMHVVSTFQPPTSPPAAASFTSTVYGYSIDYPASCTVTPATEAWVPGDKPWAGPQAWDKSPHVDQFCEGDGRFSVAATDIPDGAVPADWVEDLQSRRNSLCRTVSNGLVKPVGSFNETVIAGHPGFVRAGCGYVDGVIVIDQHAYVLSYDGVDVPRGDVAAFDDFADTIRFDVAPPSPPPSESFTSDRYHYSVAVPGGCTVTPASASWTAPAQWDVGGAVDAFDCELVDFTVVRHRIPDLMSPERWVEALPPRTAVGTESRCPDGAADRTVGRPDFTSETVAGMPGWLRAACGHIDGVAIVGRVAYIFSASGRASGEGDLEAFRRFVGSVAFTGSGTEVDTERSRSTLYGYDLRHPPTWIVSAADDPWVPDERDPGPEVADRVVIPSISGVEVLVLSAPVPTGMTEDDFVERYFALRGQDSLDPCKVLDLMSIRPVDWQPLTIDGHPGRVRAACGFIEGLAVVDERAYIVVAQGEYLYGGARATTEEAFYAVVDRLELKPEVAVDPIPFVSDLYGYSVRHAAGSQVERALEPWIPGQLPARSNRADRFVSPVSLPVTLLVASATIPDEMTEDDWLAAFVPTRRQNSYGKCTGGPGYMGLLPESWRPTTIDGREGQVRSACGYVDAVVVVDRRAYVITADGPFRYEGATEETWDQFDTFIANLTLRPAEAVATPSYAPDG